MAQKVVLITGCSSGIGLTTAVTLARDPQNRFKVIATMRNLNKRDKLEEAAGDTLNQTLEIKQLDVCDEKSIQECINSIPDRHIDILVNNAGVGMIGPIECQTIEEMRVVFETNFFGVVRMIKEVYPDMKKRKSGHIVIISSVMGLQAHRAQKQGNDGSTRTLLTSCRFVPQAASSKSVISGIPLRFPLTGRKDNPDRFYIVLDHLVLIAPEAADSKQLPLAAIRAPNQAVQDSISYGAMRQAGGSPSLREAATKRY
ncbi:RDH8 dehydrogenase, partial [Polypterus senegalus]